MKQRLQKEAIIILLYAAILLSVVGGGFNYFNSKKADRNIGMVSHTYEVLLSSKLLESLLKDAETAQRGFLLTNNASYLEPFNAAKPQIETGIKNLKELTIDNPEQQERIQKLTGWIEQKMANLQETIELGKAGDREAALSIVASGKGKELMDHIRSLIVEINSAEEVLLEARTKEMEDAAAFFRIVMIIAAVFSLTIIVAAIRTIRNERRSRNVLFAQLDEYNKSLLMNTGTGESTLDEANVINNLIHNLKDATSFIKKIGSGNYEVNLEGVSEANSMLNKENLAGELINMRDQMKKVAEAERERNWMTEGMARFADILRKNTDDLATLSTNVISGLVQYVKANQGGVYLLNGESQDEQYLELQACYAFNRKKYIDKKIAIGEGLVGQVFIEKEYIYLTDIPNNYITITSGLGGANPTSLLIVPLIVNEQICGVIELASFNQFRKIEIEFVQRIAESIASTIISVKINEQTKRLLEESQAMTEQMRAQEEEMRQNLEEMQATQEQLVRLSSEEQLG